MVKKELIDEISKRLEVSDERLLRVILRMLY